MRIVDVDDCVFEIARLTGRNLGGDNDGKMNA